MPDRIASLVNQAAERDWAQLARTAHQLKGAAGSYGFNEITPSAAKLEAMARNGEQEEAICSMPGSPGPLSPHSRVRQVSILDGAAVQSPRLN